MIGLAELQNNAFFGGFEMSKDVLSKIQAGMGGFSKGQRLIARFILESYDKAAFMTANKLGRTVKVSESTVVRFATELGYDGYPAMQKALQDIVRNKLTAVQRIEVANDRMRDQDVLSMVMHADAENIRATLDGVNRASFDRAVNAIVGARKVYIIGVRSASALADFLGYYFNMMLENVIVVRINSFSELFEQVLRVGKEDAVIGISFPRYSKRTVQVMRYAKEHGATAIAITDSEASPLTEIADHTLMAKSDMASFVDSLAAPLSLVNALIVAVSRKKNEELSSTFGKLEKIWDEYQVYQKADE